jgi:lipopolysaccharide export system protein LptA
MSRMIMITSKECLACLSVVIGIGLLATWAQGQEVKTGQKEMLDKRQPIHITSDLLEAFNDKRLVVFSGNAVAIQGDRVIRADKLLLYYKKTSEEGKPKETKDLGQTGDLERIEAKGRVNIAQGNRIATGDEAVYEQDAAMIVMTGNTVMREGKNVIRGNKITLLMNENRGIVEPQDKKRVTATIYPSEKKENKEGSDSKGDKEVKR